MQRPSNAGSGTSAAHSAVGSSLQEHTRASCSGGYDITCRVTIDMPVLGIGWVRDLIPPLTVSRTAHFPRTEPLSLMSPLLKRVRPEQNDEFAFNGEDTLTPEQSAVREYRRMLLDEIDLEELEKLRALRSDG